jgi:hypothetical protein
MTNAYGDRVARTVFDFGGVLFWAYAPLRLTALLVGRDGIVSVVRAFPAGFDLTPALRGLRSTH